jgi:hypothetical protein
MRILDAPVRRVCQGCNGGWMSQLEAQAKPPLEPMFDGNAVTLESDQQAVLLLLRPRWPSSPWTSSQRLP